METTPQPDLSVPHPAVPGPGFLFGAQYYRAPTPNRRHWAGDLAQLRKMGCNTVKYWVQWRWSERCEGEYCWQDLDELMQLAQANNLQVVLNLILDVMPLWVDRDYPDSRMQDRRGNPVETRTYLSRQLGGYPGPCCSHQVMRQKRERFTRAAVQHFKQFPALLAWDVWNEPETHSAYREPDCFPDLCYCAACAEAFRQWLRDKYRHIDVLNEVWGRCYGSFDEAELPRDSGTVNDFIDWREFHLDKITRDARWRLQVVREIDPSRLPHLHVVPNTGFCFNSLTCADDFALAEDCEIFGSSMMNDPLMCAQALSAAGGKYFYNAEWHENYGGLAMYQRVIGPERFLFELLPQLGWGVRGVLFWQYRPETLGTEAPAWGLVRPDGSPRPVTRHAEDFIRRFNAIKELFLRSVPPRPRAMIWRSRRNDIFQFCRYGNLSKYRDSLKHYADLLYALNIPFGIFDPDATREVPADTVRLLLLPQAFYMTGAEAEAIDRFVQNGGTVLSEGNLAAYAADTGRYQQQVPGGGLAEKWGVTEIEQTSSYHLSVGPDEPAELIAEGDIRKALEATGSQGDEFFPLTQDGVVMGFGAGDFAEIGGGEVLAGFHGKPCVVRKAIGRGTVFYAGTQLGYAATKQPELLRKLLQDAAQMAGIAVSEDQAALHVDTLTDRHGKPAVIICTNPGVAAQRFVPPDGRWQELYDRGLTVPPQNSFCFVDVDRLQSKE